MDSGISGRPKPESESEIPDYFQVPGWNESEHTVTTQKAVDARKVQSRLKEEEKFQTRFEPYMRRIFRSELLASHLRSSAHTRRTGTRAMSAENTSKRVVDIDVISDVRLWVSHEQRSLCCMMRDA